MSMRLLKNIAGILGVLSMLYAYPAFALSFVEGSGSTPEEAVAMAKKNASEWIANKDGNGCIGKRSGGIIKTTRMEGDRYYVEFWVSEPADACMQKKNSVNVFGLNIPF